MTLRSAPNVIGLIVAYVIVMIGIQIVSYPHGPLAEIGRGWNERCCWRGPDFLAIPAIKYASPNKARSMGNVPCSLNGWMISHFVCNAALTAAFPELWWVIFLAGTAWELWEIKLDEFQPLDLLYNALGVATGLVIAYYT